MNISDLEEGVSDAERKASKIEAAQILLLNQLNQIKTDEYTDSNGEPHQSRQERVF